MSDKTETDPLNDFDDYVNGWWTKTTQIPDDRHEWGTFHILQEENIKKIKIILEHIASDTSHKWHILGKLYESMLSLDQMNGIMIKQKIFEYLDLVDLVMDLRDVGTIMGFLTKIGINSFFEVSASEDLKNTSIVKLFLSNVGLSMPEKDYYIDKKYDTYVTEFKLVVVKTFEYFGYTHHDASGCADDVFMIEEMIARILKPVAERREFDKLYSKMSVAGFTDIMISTDDKIFQTPNGEELQRRKMISGMWENFFNASDLHHIDDLIALDLSYFRKITILLQLMPIQKIRNYMKYLLIRDLGSLLIDELDHILFEFFGRKLQGQIAMTPRSTRIIDYLGNLTGDILGKEYVKQHFDVESMSIVKQMVGQIQIQMKGSIENAQWLADKTKQKALQKLETFTTKIGHPEVWRDHDDLLTVLQNITDKGKKSPYQNKIMFNMNLSMRIYDYKTNVTDVVDKPRDPNKWSMNAYEVNAYYNPLRNEIVFPAGLIQKPFFDKNQGMFKNYGAIGYIIGHEIIHGYDDQGRKYDAQGNIVNWWSDEDLKKFTIIADKMKNQYEEYSINGQHVNGSLTLGENLADLGGVSLALGAANNAYVLSHGSAKDIENKREFFTSFANVFKKITRPEKILSRLLSDPHSPGKYRVFILRNIDEFYQAYDMEEFTKNPQRTMYLEPQMRIKMW